MSGTNPAAYSVPYDDEHNPTMPTRSLAIIKTHALKHRLTIEKRILDASFEIVKERQMEFDSGSDQEYLHELFGRDTESLFNGPVWVYVLERRRAPEVLRLLLGDEDPDQARATAPNSLRAIYGTSPAHNAFIGSPDAGIAEQQIACLFASSPPFPPAELPADELEQLDLLEDELGRLVLDVGESHTVQSPGSAASVPSSTVFGNSKAHSGSGSGSSTAGSLRGGPANNSNGRAQFRARPVPTTNAVPSIQPRTTRAAALRAGVPLEPARAAPRVVPTRAEVHRKFMDVPGHRRSSTIPVASTAPPAIAPRMTRAAALRQGITEPAPVRRQSMPGNGFEGVPGHKRRESIAVASVKAPSTPPRLNKSASLRAQKDGPPPSSFLFRPPTAPRTPGSLSRPASQTSLTRPTSTRPPSSQASPGAGTLASSPRRPMSVSRATSQTSINENGTPRRPATISRGSSQKVLDLENSAPRRPASMSRATSQPAMGDTADTTKPLSSAKKVPSRPSIAPRLNRSAMLRANSGTVSSPGTSPAARPRSSIVAKVGRAVIV